MSKIEMITGTELMKMELEPVQFIIKDFLPQGLSILAGSPKLGKSWLSLDMALSVANGSKFLGIDTNKAKVLYLSLEDSLNRLQDRINKSKGNRVANSNLMLATTCGSIGNGLEDELEELLASDRELKLIIIDTFIKVRSAYKKNESAYAYDSRDCGALKQIADKYKVAILLVHHTKKQKSDDVFASFSGTNGLFGVADAGYILHKHTRADIVATLTTTGRDIEQNEYMVQFDKDFCRWSMQGVKIEDEELEPPLMQAVKSILENNEGKWQGSISEIIEESELIGRPITDAPQVVSKQLKAITEELLKDNISYTTSKNGTGAKLHKLSIIA